jgi:hypothetical protein
MKRVLPFFTAVVCLSGMLHAQQPGTVPDWFPGKTQRPDRARAWFPDGTGLEIHTETTGTSGANSAGQIGIASEKGSRDRVNRIVIDKENHILFAYNLEASHGTRPGTIAVRIEPIGATLEKRLLGRASGGLFQPSGRHVPTVAKIREFPAVSIGQALTLDILYNPSTSEKIYDVLRPITEPSPAPERPVVTEVRAHQALSLHDIAVSINGEVIHVPASWIIGAVARIDFPGHGAYVLAVENPSNVAPAFAFRSIAHADGKTLRWTMDGDNVEITSRTNVLTQTANGVLWIYHQSQYALHDQPNLVRLQAADTVEWALPNRTIR